MMGAVPTHPCFFFLQGYSIIYNTDHAVLIVSDSNTVAKTVSEYDQEIPQSQTADNPQKTNRIKYTR